MRKKQSKVFLKLLFSCFNCVRLFSTPWTIACQAPLFMGFSSQDYWSGLPFPPPGHLPKPGIKPTYPVSPALAVGFFIIEPPEKRYVYMYRVSNLGGTKQESEK